MFPLSILSLNVINKYNVNPNIPSNKIKGPTLLKNVEINPELDAFERFIILFIKNPTRRIMPEIIKVYEEIDTLAFASLFMDNAIIDNTIPTNIKPWYII